MIVTDLGVMPYRQAWEAQRRAHEEVLAGGPERLFTVEHTPVITLGRRASAARHLLADEKHLAAAGVELVQSDRGGDITFHGPGQLVVYPIVRLADHGLSVGGYVRRLLDTVITILGEFGIQGRTDPSAIGVWVDTPSPAKICALGVRIRRGVSLHGVALNVTTDLRYFGLIVPCGLPRPVTSMQQLLAERTPPMEEVKAVAVAAFCRTLEAGRHATDRGNQPAAH